MEPISLKHESRFLQIVDGDMIFYGGDQAWFEFTVGIYGGCGVVAAANIAAYLGLSQVELKPLYHYKNLKKVYFLEHMKSMYNYIKPWKIPFVNNNHPPYKTFGWTFGIWPISRLKRGLLQFGRERNVPLEGRQILGRRPFEEVLSFIRTSLEADCPVAMLIVKGLAHDNTPVTRPDGVSWRQTTFARHWVTITSVREQRGGIYVKVSTWGGYSWLNLQEWHRAENWISGLVSVGRCTENVEIRRGE